MPHTSIIQMLRCAVRAAGEASLRRTETARVLDERRARSSLSRREFIATTSGLALATLGGPSLLARKGAGSGLATIDHWPSDPFSLGSYSYWQIGQYTRFAGIEGEQEGNAHFCGEHTSIDAQGYLEGAVESGERAAAEVISNLAG